MARSIRATLGDEIRRARREAGLSQRAAGVAAAMSHAQFGRIERGDMEHVTLEQVACAGAVVGLRLTARLYPDGDPVRDAAQLRLISRLRRCLPDGVGWRTEVPLPIPGDRRAWDAVATLSGGDVAFEAETRLLDVQALERRVALKQRDGAVERIVLLIADSAANRRAIELHRADLRASFPLDARAILGALRDGRRPDGSGLVML
ncbi:MAG: helix-turn-helix domain-containing protein [Chloroflexi bacterium]|nr:helix-turn-helix domain-containing protein [Chloroflexota bacterium]